MAAGANATSTNWASPAPSPRTFFFQAEDGIRVGRVTGVQTCALPISRLGRRTATYGEWHTGELCRRAARPAAGDGRRPPGRRAEVARAADQPDRAGRRTW